MIKSLGWQQTQIDEDPRLVIQMPIDNYLEREDLFGPLIEKYMLESMSDRWVVLDKKDIDHTIHYAYGHTPINLKPITDVRNIIGYVRYIDIKNKTADVVLSKYNVEKLIGSGLMTSDKQLRFMTHVIKNKGSGKPPVLVEILYAYLEDGKDENCDS